MSSEVLISAHALGKRYNLYDHPYQRLLQGFLGRRKTLYREFWAVRGIDFEVRRGETVGIIGRNGSGKSTLLQLICGILTATEGTVATSGRIAGMLELGAGFNPEFTGRENVYLNAALFGLSREQVDERLERILAFAEIGDFVDQPVKTYSSGMFVRLGFAVMAYLDADILIVDEALSVGDAFFVQKCMRFLREFRERGTLLFVSHDSGAVVNLCDRAIWLEGGRQLLDGAPREITEAYLESIYTAKDPSAARLRRASLPERTAPKPVPVKTTRQADNDIALSTFDPASAGFGSGGARITDVWLEDEFGRRLVAIRGGERVRLCIRGHAEQAIPRPIFGFVIKDRLGQSLFGENTYSWFGDDPRPLAPGQDATAHFEFEMPLLPSGHYAVTVAIAEGSQADHVQHHWLHEALVFESHYPNGLATGLIGLPMYSVGIEPFASEGAAP
jgi:lipopolysaccharide transport system ATP-binding protein